MPVIGFLGDRQIAIANHHAHAILTHNLYISQYSHWRLLISVCPLYCVTLSKEFCEAINTNQNIKG